MREEDRDNAIQIRSSKTCDLCQGRGFSREVRKKDQEEDAAGKGLSAEETEIGFFEYQKKNKVTEARSESRVLDKE